MATIHDEIDTWLAADLHGELSNNERNALHAHLLDCAACRKTHQEIKTMNKILEETLAQEKPDPAFEQRMLAGFRKRAPQRAGLVKLLVDLMRLRAVQITAVAAALLGLVQIGRMITGENATSRHERYAEAEVAAPQPPESLPSQAGALGRSGGIAAGRPQDLAIEAPAPPPATRSKFREESKAAAATVAPAKAAQGETTESEAFAATPESPTNAEEAGKTRGESPAPALANRKLIRNAIVELEILSFDNAVQKITAVANEEHGYVATTDSEKQANGKRRGQVVVKVLPASSRSCRKTSIAFCKKSGALAN